MTASQDLTPGTKLRFLGYRNPWRPDVVTLDRRKTPADVRSDLPFHPGWNLVEGGGLADFVIEAEDSKWEVVDPERSEVQDSDLLKGETE